MDWVCYGPEDVDRRHFQQAESIEMEYAYKRVFNEIERWFAGDAQVVNCGGQLLRAWQCYAYSHTFVWEMVHCRKPNLKLLREHSARMAHFP